MSDMFQKIPEQNENPQIDTPVDPWEAAFAALNKEEEDPSAAITGAEQGVDGDGVPNPESNDGQGSPAQLEAEDGIQAEGLVGGPGDLGGADDGPNGGAEDSVFRFTEEEAKAYRDDLMDSIEQQTLRDVANAYIKQGARHTNGRLGATIQDPDICKRDSDGVPRFYNPETGREFTGDNPRRQAQEWVDDYNRELADNFNRTCTGYSKKLLDEQGVGLKVIEFAPKYEELDDVRKAMFESIIEDYEVRDKDGDLVGYSCDLDKALNAVNRQVKTMQTRFGNQAKSQQQVSESKPSGPALDMKNSAGNAGDGKMPEFKSIAEAMEWQQDQILKKQKEGK